MTTSNTNITRIWTQSSYVKNKADRRYVKRLKSSFRPIKQSPSDETLAF